MQVPYLFFNQTMKIKRNFRVLFFSAPLSQFFKILAVPLIPAYKLYWPKQTSLSFCLGQYASALQMPDVLLCSI